MTTLVRAGVIGQRDHGRPPDRERAARRRRRARPAGRLPVPPEPATLRRS